jgi:hypothetical protein
MKKNNCGFKLINDTFTGKNDVNILELQSAHR